MTAIDTERRGRHRRMPSSRRDDGRLARNSLYLMATTGATAVSGFVFSIIVTHSFHPREVGIGTSLIAASTAIAHFSLLGLDSAVIRFFSHMRDVNAFLTRSVALVAVTATVLATAYVISVPLYAPELAFVRDHYWLLAIFALCTACAGINLFTDALFTGSRRPKFNLLTDGIIQGIAKIVLPFACVGLGGYGIFLASGGAFVVAAAASILLAITVLGGRVRWRAADGKQPLYVTYSSSNYIASCLSFVPAMLLPIMCLSMIGASAAAYFYLSFQIANTLFGVSYAVGLSTFAEGSQSNSDVIRLMKKSALLMVAMQFVPVVILLLFGEQVLSVFGADYAANGTTLLRVFAVAAFAVSVNMLGSFALKILTLVKQLVISTIIAGGVTIAVAVTMGDRGLWWFGIAWLAGQLASGLYAGTAVLRHLRRELQRR